MARHVAWPSRLAQALSVSLQLCAARERRSTVIIPFGAFQLTYKGVVQHVQPAINRNRIKNIGVILNDQKTGPFAIEMAELSALTSPGGVPTLFSSTGCPDSFFAGR